MSTSCKIGFEKNGVISAVYCHWDGYLEYTGSILINNYNNETEAFLLISMGNMSQLREKILPTTEKHSFEEPEDDVTIYYNRDRGDDWQLCKPKKYHGYDEFLEEGCEYNYVFISKDKKWYLVTDEGNKPLEDVVSHIEYTGE